MNEKEDEEIDKEYEEYLGKLDNTEEKIKLLHAMLVMQRNLIKEVLETLGQIAPKKTKKFSFMRL